MHLSATAHEDLATRTEAILRRLLHTDNYDSVNNFIALYDTFNSNRNKQALTELFASYVPPIRAKKHTCVGLNLELIKRWKGLVKYFNGIDEAISLFSCEEAVISPRDYVSCGEGPESVVAAEKEHVMAGIHITVDGRPGVLLADPGYHVPRILTVMQDRNYPHTGWFTQSDEPQCQKEYNYTINQINPSYVEWHERETRETDVKYKTSLIYIGRPYLDGINVTERRNLVYNFKSLLSRDQKGHLTAGLYFPVGARGKDAQFTIFYTSGSEKRKIKYKFCTFLDRNAIPEDIAEEIQQCNSQMNYKKGDLMLTICKLAQIMSHETFINQMLEINDEICRLSIN